MPIYKQTTEITNIDDLLSSVERDIEEVYFGDKNIFTVWSEYEGTIPATLNANGDDMRQYQVWGNTGGVGVKSGNLFDWNWLTNGYHLSPQTGLPVEHLNRISILQPIRINSASGAFLSYVRVGNNNVKAMYSVLADDDTLIRRVANIDTGDYLDLTGGSKLYIAFYDSQSSTTIFTKDNVDNIMLTEGSTAPTSFVPYGYKLDMGVKSGNVMPSAPAETKTSNGITVTCDGEGRYSISGETDQNTDIIFNIPSFTVPVSIYNSGNGFMMLHNTAFSNVNLDFLYNGTNKDAWSLATANRTSTVFSRLSGIQINAIRFHVTAGTVNGIVCPMFTNNGESTPVKYQPYSSTTTPIYIGDDPLEKDEYVDYAEQKVYRRTANVFNADIERGGIGTGSGANTAASNRLRSAFMNSLLSAGTYTLKFDGVNDVTMRAYDAEKNYERTASILDKWYQSPFTFTIDENLYIRFVFRKSDDSVLYVDDISNIMLTPGTTPPETYTPYLQPTDPPVPLPALPTCEGETIVDYAGESVAPEKVLLKYRKKNF